jgi:hypothetical protein
VPVERAAGSKQKKKTRTKDVVQTRKAGNDKSEKKSEAEMSMKKKRKTDGPRTPNRDLPEAGSAKKKQKERTKNGDKRPAKTVVVVEDRRSGKAVERQRSAKDRADQARDGRRSKRGRVEVVHLSDNEEDDDPDDIMVLDTYPT